MNVPDSTNYGNDVMEICRRALPLDMICKICDKIICPPFIFIFSCGHYYHGYCAGLVIGKKNPAVKCRRCTIHSSRSDRNRLLNLPWWVMQSCNN